MSHMDLTRTEPDLQDMVNELTTEHIHDEPYVPDRSGAAPRFVARHRAKVPSLIDQLLEPATGAKGDMSGSEAQARPAVRVEAHDTIALIAEASGEWIDHLGGTIPAEGLRGHKIAAHRGSGVKRSLVRLRALHAGLRDCGRAVGGRFAIEVDEDPEFDSKDSLLGEERRDEPKVREWCCESHHIEEDVRSWWRQARIISGWDSPTYRPRATCPQCSDIRSLRVNLGAHTAVCVACRTVWGPGNIGLLAEHIRLEVEGAPDDEVEGELEVEDDLEALEVG